MNPETAEMNAAECLILAEKMLCSREILSTTISVTVLNISQKRKKMDEMTSANENLEWRRAKKATRSMTTTTTTVLMTARSEKTILNPSPTSATLDLRLSLQEGSSGDDNESVVSFSLISRL